MKEGVRIEVADGLVEVRVTGKLTHEVYEKLVPVVEAELREKSPLDVIFVMEDFHGWTAGALWEDVKFDLKHFRDIRRLALVGDKRWQRGMAVFCRPFTSAKVKYFPHSELAEAREWVRATDEEENAEPSGSTANGDGVSKP